MQGPRWWSSWLLAEARGWLGSSWLSHLRRRSLEGAEFWEEPGWVVWWVISVNSTIGLAKKFIWVFCRMVREHFGQPNSNPQAERVIKLAPVHIMLFTPHSARG